MTVPSKQYWTSVIQAQRAHAAYVDGRLLGLDDQTQNNSPFRLAQSFVEWEYASGSLVNKFKSAPSSQGVVNVLCEYCSFMDGLNISFCIFFSPTIEHIGHHADCSAHSKFICSLGCQTRVPNWHHHGRGTDWLDLGPCTSSSIRSISIHSSMHARAYVNAHSTLVQTEIIGFELNHIQIKSFHLKWSHQHKQANSHTDIAELHGVWMKHKFPC